MTSSPSKFIMTDCTDDVLSSDGPFDDNVQLYLQETTDMLDELPEMNILIDKRILNSKPKLKQAIISGLDPDNKMTGEITDDMILESINMFPKIREDYCNLFYELDLCKEREGECTYYPSILDVDNIDDIKSIQKLSGFREFHQEIPHKYIHLSHKCIELIYGNPHIRKLVSRMKPEHITNNLITSMLH
uniref:Uncharacterized protein n=1 Tax=viral metagenome TaxID=1070528 RepID=A0A6C0J591_9ZZZZ